jgi:beta-N-acetylhexosaminidase
VATVAAYPKYSGIMISNPERFSFSLPEDAGINSNDLSRIDSIALKAIKQGATPGCQILVAKDQKIIYYKSFGTHTYHDTARVLNSDLYDIASVTKIAATCLATMKLVDEKKLDLDHLLSEYLPELKGTNKKNLVIRDVLAHQAGLQSWIPFWKQTITAAGSLSEHIYIRKKSDAFSTRVAEGIFMRNDYRDSVMQWIYNSPLAERGKYVYSDFGPILLKSVVEKITDQPFDQYLDREFYHPLGLSNLTFQPADKFSLKQVVPTENDIEFRHQLIHGDVHDPAAAMLGGISGNAGLFSDAYDLAVIMQLYLNGGTYGGKHYLDESTVREFSRQQFPQNNNRRGLFFDKPEPDLNKSSPVSKSASMKTFGHQGFTGTCAWVDPEYNLIYIFLSNRVNPDASNDKLVKMNVRTDIQQVIYDSFKK